MENPHSGLFLQHHATSPFSELHNNNLLYLLWHSKLRVQKCAPIFVFAVLLVSSLISGKAWQACAQQTEKKHSHTNSAFSCEVYVHALLVQHLVSVFFQHIICNGPKSGKVFDAEGAEKLVKIYRLCRAEEDND